MKIEEIVHIFNAPITKDIRKGRSNSLRLLISTIEYFKYACCFYSTVYTIHFVLHCLLVLWCVVKSLTYALKYTQEKQYLAYKHVGCIFCLKG